MQPKQHMIKNEVYMDDATLEAMNAKLDILFDQIEELPDEQKVVARGAVMLWNSAKVQESIGLGPMEARHVYHIAYDALDKIGLDVGGMIPPYRGANSALTRSQ